MTATDKRYLGDGVYAAWDGCHLVLTTNNGREVQNCILIDEHIWAAMVDYVEYLRKKAQAGTAESTR